MSFNVFRSTDTDAPVLPNALGSLLDVLDACLVDGYGGKQPLGWSRPFAHSNNMGAYTNVPANGNPIFLSVDDNRDVGGSNEGGNAIVYLFESMSAPATGNGQRPSGGDPPRIPKSDNVDPAPWMLVGDERAFFLEVGYNSTDFGTCYVGEYDSYVAGDPFAHILLPAYIRSDDYPTNNFQDCRLRHSYSADLNSDNSNVALQRTADGSVPSGPGGDVGPSCPFNTSGQYGDLSSGRGIPYPNATDSLVSAELYVLDSTNNVIRGKLRGIRGPLHRGLAASVSAGDTVTIDGQTWEVRVYGEEVLLVQTTEWA